MTKLALALGMMATVLLLVGAIASSTSDSASADAGGIAAMSVDMDPTGNTATSLGDRQECVEVSAGDEVDIDITALDVPESNPILAFQARVLHDADYISVTASDVDFLLAVLPGSNLLDVSAVVVPGVYLSAASDLEPAASESGSGVLSRLTIAIDEGTPPGGYPLILDPDDTGTVDDQSAGHEPQSLNHGQLAVDVTCGSLPPPGTPTPPGLDVAWGDVDCDGGVDLGDAIKIGLAGIGSDVDQEEGCPGIDDPVSVAFDSSDIEREWGDVDCDGGVDLGDAIKIGLSGIGSDVDQSPPCPEIESDVTVS